VFVAYFYGMFEVVCVYVSVCVCELGKWKGQKGRREKEKRETLRHTWSQCDCIVRFQM
jgi:hypothetical protein